MKKQKQQLFDFCTAYVTDRVARVQGHINEIQFALTTETKSSAGDKHETGRAMLQLEREKLGKQLFNIEKMQAVLNGIRIENTSPIVILGSLVKTSKADYYLAVSAGKYDGKTTPIYCISTVSPIGRLLMGKATGDEVFFNGKPIRIMSIF